MTAYAIIEAGGMQFRAERDSRIRVPKMNAEPGTDVSFAKVLVLSDGSNVTVGMPYVELAEVKGKLLSHGRHEKRIVFKMKKRKNYRRKAGHKQGYSEILITDILGPKFAAREAAPEKMMKTEAPPEKKAAPKKVTKAAPKKPRAAAVRPKPARGGKEAARKPRGRGKAKEEKAGKRPAAKAKRTTKGVMGRLRRRKRGD
jgi:large subunit ribosomal protein L21